MTSLYAIHLKTEKQTPVTFPKQDELDVNPQKVGDYLTWIRRTKNPYKGDIRVKDGQTGREQLRIKNVDESPSFFVQNEQKNKPGKMNMLAWLILSRNYRSTFKRYWRYEMAVSQDLYFRTAIGSKPCTGSVFIYLSI